MTGDGPLGIGHSGVSVSAIGYRLQVPAADPKFKLLLRSMPACQQIPTARRAVLPKQPRHTFAQSARARTTQPNRFIFLLKTGLCFGRDGLAGGAA